MPGTCPKRNSLRTSTDQGKESVVHSSIHRAMSLLIDIGLRLSMLIALIVIVRRTSSRHAQA